ncbi:PREDICTED: E3 ubiquitin-protein ligase MIEL1-like [Lupinus angustifolius]|uniref:E3 ubiquitin-protein ligase MIEL1-like n=1 Tax=Lupinus angustifolius TaxID=3871 RepID=UPI00092F5EC9|nr:PREDICTED: E3 ubiquitin-protein ligase MIEL1-like [Lupinus angustifolius]XP_019450438.1 PREDICTED: E3 ubiquitin-protein ligase MIEL1-like [Lupinus angustifolius]
MKFLVVGIAIMKLRLSAPYVTSNKMFNSTAPDVEYAWASIIVVHANSSMMIFGRNNTTVTNVASAEAEVWITSFILRDVKIEEGHPCVERAMHHNYPICFEYLFETLRDVTVLPCGHTIHIECVRGMKQLHRYACPVCSKSMCDMTNLCKKLDDVVASTPVPEMYKDKMVWILCNDRGANSHVQFHIVAHKCKCCNSYNTRQIQGNPGNSCSS